MRPASRAARVSAARGSPARLGAMPAITFTRVPNGSRRSAVAPSGESAPVSATTAIACRAAAIRAASTRRRSAPYAAWP
jgi:hypothetical protein